METVMEARTRVARDQLEATARTVAARIDNYLNSTDEGLDQQIQDTARTLVATMEESEPGNPDSDGGIAARRTLALVTPVEHAEWWNTALGQLVARHVGYGEDEVPRSHAAAILGVSRQAIHQALEAGHLDHGVGGSVTNASLLANLRAHGRRS